MANNAKKAVFVLGLKWFDKVNGNTYNRAVIITDNGERISTEYGYGYGDSYYYAAKQLCTEKGIAFDYPPHTDKYVTKKQAKDENYY